ncbi:MAG TPA: TIGR03084 family metal-binding protein [Streptosporangiaceae bacterium]|nr:TIGR03084 family metal-binding protein [Streptosporangiaceae bacterium]
MDLLTSVLTDLDAESAWLDDIVGDLADAGWRTQTPAPGWTVAHQIAHLAWTDDQATAAATNPDALAATLTDLLAGTVTVDSAAEARAGQRPPDLLEGWRAGRARLGEALAATPQGTRLPWFGPPMSGTSMATARLMETWAHGQDVADALGAPHPAPAGLRHITYLVVRTRDYAFTTRGLAPPPDPFRIVLTSPDGAEWDWGPDDAPQRIAGTALDLCLLATQRRHRSDTTLKAIGGDADLWLDIAQAFAGPPGEGRKPSSEHP